MDTDDRHLNLETVLLRIGTLAGAVAGTVGFLYAVGGAVMWLRFARAQLPADQALALVPRTDLLVIGMRVLIIPALAAGALFVLLAKRRRSSTAGRIGPGALAVIAVTVLGLVLVVPAAPGAYAWPVAALGLWYVWVRGLAPRNGRMPREVVWRAAVAAMLAAAVVSIARQLDHPVKLPSATVQLTNDDTVVGVLVAAGTDEVVVGLPEERRLASFARKDVERIAIEPALDRRAPARSLLSNLLGGEAWAATPLEVWCGGESYSWIEVSDLCETQPEIAGKGEYRRNGVLRVPVSCPPTAGDGCVGFLTVTTEDTYELPEFGRAQPLRLGHVAFRIEPGQPLNVEMTVNEVHRRCLRGAERWFPVRALLSSDRAGLGPLNDRVDQELLIERRGERASARDNWCAEPLDDGDRPRGNADGDEKKNNNNEDETDESESDGSDSDQESGGAPQNDDSQSGDPPGDGESQAENSNGEDDAPATEEDPAATEESEPGSDTSTTPAIPPTEDAVTDPDNPPAE